MAGKGDMGVVPFEVVGSYRDGMLDPVDHVGGRERTPVGHVVALFVAGLIVAGEEP